MHQRDVIEAALAALSARWSEAFTVLGVPDEVERELPAVDLLVEGANGRHLVIEHTIVESFPGRIRDDVLFTALAERVERRLKDRLPLPGHYRLVLEPGGLTSKKAIAEVVEPMARWAERAAVSLELGSSLAAPNHVARGVLDPWGLEVRLERWPGREGQVRVFRMVPEDLDAQRRARIAQAMEAKIPKLAEARGEAGESVLVLESNDLALGNYVDIATAVVSMLEGRSDVPDVICLVETDVGEDVWLIKERGSTFPDIQQPGPFSR